MKSTSKISKSLTVILSLTFALTLSILVSCKSGQAINTKDYPNTQAENAIISNQYNDTCQTISKSAIDEFKKLTKIPRESGNMDGIRNYLLSWAKAHNVNATLDKSGNIYIDLCATSGMEHVKNIIIQSHMDMVVNTKESYKDFNAKTSPIELESNEETGELHSKNYQTNIGADDGQGIGLCLSLIKHSNEFKHGPIRLLFTYDEETTYAGAKTLDTNILNADYLINFDNGWVGECVNGSVGTFAIKFDKKYAAAAPTEKGASENLTIKVSDLKGGHSGSDIDKPRISAASVITKYLDKLKDNTIHFRIVSINCGKANNAIADSCTMTLNINKKNEDSAKNIFNELIDKIKKEYSEDNELSNTIEVTEASGMFPSKQDSEKILDVLKCIPNGVTEKESNNNVKTSCNLGIIMLENGVFHCDAMFRSSDNNVLKEQAKEISNSLKDKKITIDIKDEDIDVAWTPEESSLTRMYYECMKDACNIPARVNSIHAGLEISIIKTIKPSLQCISIGGDIKNEHALTETFYTKSFPVAVLPIIYILDHVNELN